MSWDGGVGFPVVRTWPLDDIPRVSTGEASGAGFEKVNGLFLTLDIARTFWLRKLDFHMHPQQPPKLSSNLDQYWWSFWCQRGTRKTTKIGLNWRFWNLQIRTKPEIDKNIQILIFFLQYTISGHKNYDISIQISLNMYIVHYFWQCSDLEVPGKTKGKSR